MFQLLKQPFEKIVCLTMNCGGGYGGRFDSGTQNMKND